MVLNRRELLQAGIGTALTGVTRASVSTKTPTIPAATQPYTETPNTTATFTAHDHRRRLENIRFCERAIRCCMHKHLITGYLPGQCVYNLGEYPCRKPWTTDRWDEQELDKLRDEGIRLIQVHEEWNDALRLFGQDKFTPLNPSAFQRFVNMVHARGMKLIVYVSSGFFHRPDRDYQECWARGKPHVALYWNNAWCSPASTSWRAYLLPRLTRIMDDYGVDGLYNDLGYRRLADDGLAPTQDEVLAFQESLTHDAALEDLLGLIYAEVKRRGGIVKIHHGGGEAPKTNLKVYDYLWVGEGVRAIDSLREASKNHPPYAVPCVDLSRTSIVREEELYLHSIPYMQFPLLQAGRPFTGERAVMPNISYHRPETCEFTKHIRSIWRYYQEHPDGPHSYGWWDSVPGRLEARPTHARWLRQYQAMTQEGTRAYLELADNDVFAQPLPNNVVASMFANRDLYLVLANYTPGTVNVVTRDHWAVTDSVNIPLRTDWTLAPRSLMILRHVAAT